MTKQKPGDLVTCSLFLIIEGARLNLEQSQGSSSFNIQTVQTQKLRHTDFRYLLEIRKFKVHNFFKIYKSRADKPERIKQLCVTEIVAGHVSWSEHYA
jgi:hypothetical protein